MREISILKEGVMLFHSTRERDKWLRENAPTMRPIDQELSPGRHEYGPWIIKLSGDGVTIKIIKQKRITDRL